MSYNQKSLPTPEEITAVVVGYGGRLPPAGDHDWCPRSKTVADGARRTAEAMIMSELSRLTKRASARYGAEFSLHAGIYPQPDVEYPPAMFTGVWFLSGEIAAREAQKAVLALVPTELIVHRPGIDPDPLAGVEAGPEGFDRLVESHRRLSAQFAAFGLKIDRMVERKGLLDHAIAAAVQAQLVEDQPVRR